MSSVGTLTGRNGKFKVGATTVARATQWGVSPKLAATAEWGDSDSAGYTNRAPGRMDSTFTSEGKYEQTAEIFDLFKPGDYSAATLFMTPAQTGPPSVESLYWAFPSALNTDFSMTINIDTEEVIGWNSSWGADGQFYYPGQAGAPVVSFP